MKRREFITLLGGAAAWPLAARAQQGKVPTIGLLGTSTSSAMGPRLAAFLQRLRDLGWIENRTVAIDIGGPKGSERYAEIAAEFVRLKVDVVVTSGTVPVEVVKQATSTIPVVFATAADPIGTGLWICLGQKEAPTEPGLHS